MPLMPRQQEVGGSARRMPCREHVASMRTDMPKSPLTGGCHARIEVPCLQIRRPDEETVLFQEPSPDPKVRNVTSTHAMNMPAWSTVTTALEVVQDIDLTGRTAIVTGAASGIGVETARALATAGAAVTLAVRDPGMGARVAEDIVRTSGNRAISVRSLDLADLASVDAFVTAWNGPLHILVNNAGVMNTPELRTAGGWEMQFAVNHLGHFALATGLHQALAASGSARVVAVSSSGHGSSPIRFDDLFFERDAYDPGVAYGQSKTANVLFALEATRRWQGDGVIAKAVMPGGIWTNLQRHWDPATRASMKAKYPGKTPGQGAATSLFVATSPDITPDGPVYYEDCAPAEVVPFIIDGLHGVMPHALDEKAASRLWDLSETLVAEGRA